MTVFSVNVFAEKLAVVNAHNVVENLRYKVGPEAVAPKRKRKV